MSFDKKNEKFKKSSWLKSLGPGLITGAADDDPSGITTYSQAGATFGLNMLWTVLFTLPLMAGIQIVSARIGRVTGEGLSANLRKFYHPWVLYSIVGLLLFANTVNIAADISAMGESFRLVVGGSAPLYAICFGVTSLLLQLFIPYSRYVRFLKWLTLTLLSYVATVFVVQIPWHQVLIRTLFPQITLSADYITIVVGVFGTTISPYLFFWQASQEVEEKNLLQVEYGKKLDPSEADQQFRRIKFDTFVGMGFSNLIAFFIILSTAVTLHVHGINSIQTAAEAATALRPFAGDFSFFLFSMGIIGTGLLAVPVLAGSSAYAIAEAFNWHNRSLELHPRMAKRFYAIIVFSTLVGVAICFAKINPIKALFVSAVINGVISVPIMGVMMMMASDANIMGQMTIHRNLKILGWGAVLCMLVVVVAMFVLM